MEDLKRHMNRFTERVKHVYPEKRSPNLGDLVRNLIFQYQVHDTKKSFTVFEFEPLYVQDEALYGAQTWTGKIFPISVSISSNLMKEPTFYATLILISLLHPLRELRKVSRHQQRTNKALFCDNITIKIQLGIIVENQPTS